MNRLTRNFFFFCVLLFWLAAGACGSAFAQVKEEKPKYAPGKEKQDRKSVV